MPSMKIKELGADGSTQEALSIELPEEEISKFKIGQKVEVALKGSVGMLEIPPGGTTKDDPPLMGIRIVSKSVKGLNDFAELASDADEED